MAAKRYAALSELAKLPLFPRATRFAPLSASPLDQVLEKRRALKVRNMECPQRVMPLFQSWQTYRHFPGATRLAPLSACPWLSYFAPLALTPLQFPCAQPLALSL